MKRGLLASLIGAGIAVLAFVVLRSISDQHGSGAGASDTGSPPTTHAVIGFSDENPTFFFNPYFRLLAGRLTIHTARLIAAYDAASAAAPWVAAAERAGQSPYVSLGGDDSCNNPAGVHPATGNCPPPTDPGYTLGFVAMVETFPAIVDWGAWNEPSNYVYFPCATPHAAPAPPAHACRPVRLDARRAAGYWRDAVAADRLLSRHDTIVAGETGLDCIRPALNLCTTDGGGTWTGYLPRYLAALGPARPAVWGAHAYHDLQQRPPLANTETNLFVRFLNSRAGAPSIWLSEEGTWLEGRYGTLLNGNGAAQADAAREFLNLPLVPAARSGQIAREYYYFLQADRHNGFDSALLDVNGRPRPAFCTLVGEPLAHCPGSTTDSKNP